MANSPLESQCEQDWILSCNPYMSSLKFFFEIPERIGLDYPFGIIAWVRSDSPVKSPCMGTGLDSPWNFNTSGTRLSLGIPTRAGLDSPSES